VEIGYERVDAIIYACHFSAAACDFRPAPFSQESQNRVGAGAPFGRCFRVGFLDGVCVGAESGIFMD
jgi:hypothetical protein